MRIKTVIENKSSDFDSAVNQALAEGWRLVRRDVVRIADKSSRLYAELVMIDQPKEPDLFECAEVIRQACATVNSCEECPLENICQFDSPNKWRPMEEEANDSTV